MLNEIFSEDQKQKDSTWDFLKREMSGIELSKTRCLEVDQNTKQSEFDKTMALVQVANHYANKTEMFLSTEQLFNLAAKQTDAKLDIDEVSCVYVFLSLLEEQCIKVGQSNNVRERFVKGHFDISRNTEQSHLCNYYIRDWPKSINEEEVVVIIFPMYGSEEKDRLAVESGLTGFLHPIMP